MVKKYNKYLLIFFCLLWTFLTVRCASIAMQPAQTGDQAKEDVTQAITQSTVITDPNKLINQTPVITNPNVPTSQAPALPNPTVITDTQGEEGATLSMAPSSTIEPSQADEYPTEDDLEEIDLTTWLTYTDTVYHFSVSYPPYLVVNQVDQDKLAQLSRLPQSPPAPSVAAIWFQDQRMELVDIAPPVFSIHIYENETSQPIEAWLGQTGLLNPEVNLITEPYRGKQVTGLKIISQDYIAPGSSVFVARGSQVFQLTPLGTEAELMLDSFTFTQ